VSTGLFALVLAMAFVAGVTIGVIAMVSFAIRREERAFPLYSAGPGLVSRGARRVTGYVTRTFDR
jgi:hypothetical protein